LVENGLIIAHSPIEIKFNRLKFSPAAFLFFLGFFGAGLFSELQAQNIPEPSNPPKLVNDFADVLSPDQENALEQKLIAFEDSTSNQLAIVLIKSLEGYEIADYSVQLALKWGIGTKKNNGILLLAAIDDRKVRIEVGYGLEGVVTDAISKRIITQTIKPYFKQSGYYEGLDAATNDLFSASKGEFQGEFQYSKGKKKGKGLGIGIIIIIVILIFIFSRKGGGGGGGFFTGMLLGQLLGGNRHGGGFGDFSGGKGDFGGFGGGSFGGGGSSGDW